MITERYILTYFSFVFSISKLSVIYEKSTTCTFGNPSATNRFKPG